MLTLNIISLAIFINAVYAAPSLPANCPARMKKMDDSMKIALIISNEDQKLNQKEDEFNSDYCM